MPSSYSPHLGGVEEVSKSLATGLQRRGHDALVVTNRWPKDLPAAETIDGVAVERRAFRVPQRSVRGIGGWALYSAATRKAIIARARAHACDLVNIHCVSSNADYALAVSKQLSLPLVVSVHGELSCDASDVYGRSRTLQRAWLRLIEAADVITAPSQFSLTEAETYYGQPFRVPTRVIPNGVDLDFFGGPRTTPARPYVFAVGRLVPTKGFDILIRAWEQRPSELADVDLVIGGDGPQRAALQAQINQSGATGVTLVGRLGRAEVAQRMRSATAFVLPSRVEALGLTVLEAMAAGTPVIAAAVDGVPEIVDDGRTGLLFKTEDADALASAISEVFRDLPAAHARAQAASDVVTKYTWDACTDAFLEAYETAS